MSQSLFEQTCQCSHSILDHETGGCCRAILRSASPAESFAERCPCVIYRDRQAAVIAARLPPTSGADLCVCNHRQNHHALGTGTCRWVDAPTQEECQCSEYRAQQAVCAACSHFRFEHPERVPGACARFRQIAPQPSTTGDEDAELKSWLERLRRTAHDEGYAEAMRSFGAFLAQVTPQVTALVLAQQEYAILPKEVWDAVQNYANAYRV